MQAVGRLQVFPWYKFAGAFSNGIDEFCSIRSLKDIVQLLLSKIKQSVQRRITFIFNVISKKMELLSSESRYFLGQKILLILKKTCLFGKSGCLTPFT